MLTVSHGFTSRNTAFCVDRWPMSEDKMAKPWEGFYDFWKNSSQKPLSAQSFLGILEDLEARQNGKYWQVVWVGCDVACVWLFLFYTFGKVEGLLAPLWLLFCFSWCTNLRNGSTTTPHRYLDMRKSRKTKQNIHCTKCFGWKQIPVKTKTRGIPNKARSAAWEDVFPMPSNGGDGLVSWIFSRR